MALLDFMASRSFRRLSSLSMVVEAGMALLRGNKRVAALLLGAATLAYRWSWVGILAELGIRGYQWTRSDAA